MKKLILFFAMMFLMFGLVSADRVISGLEELNIPMSNVVAGSSFEAKFSFDYFSGGNEDDSPLIIQLNISSGDNSYPVGKDEFWVSGTAEKSWLNTGLFSRTVEFNCSEVRDQTIEHPKDAAFVVADDGTFYCYNEEGDLRLGQRDEITLRIVSHQAIYPGKYDLSAKLFYLEDERAPFVDIMNRDDFDLWYRENDRVSVEVNVSDGSVVSQVYGIADLVSGTMDFVSYYREKSLYYFQENTPVDIPKGEYSLVFFAEDEYGNVGNDSVTLKIDRSAPDIVLIKPDDVVGDIMEIEVEITDNDKAGVNDSSVMYKLKAQGCDDGFNDPYCYNSGWVFLPNIGGVSYGVEINITEEGLTSGSYNLQIRASDILGNMGVLE